MKFAEKYEVCRSIDGEAIAIFKEKEHAELFQVEYHTNYPDYVFVHTVYMQVPSFLYYKVLIQ